MKIIDVIGKDKWRILPDSVLLKGHNPFFIPDFPGGVEAIPALAFRIDKLGKGIPARFAPRHYHEMAPAVVFRAENYAEMLRENGIPDSPGYIFDKSVVVGEFLKYSPGKDSEVIVSLSPIRKRDNENSYISEIFQFPDPATAVNEAIEAVGRDNTLKTGDLFLINGLGNPIFTEPDSRLLLSGNDTDHSLTSLAVNLK